VRITCIFIWIFSFSFISPSNVALAMVPEQAREQHRLGVFGIIIKGRDGKDEFKVSNTVPLIEGQSYGWIIKRGSGIAKVKLKEVFELPARPETWGPGEASGEQDISEDGRILTSEKEILVEDGHIESFWSVASGDPLGDYVIRVYVNDVLLKTFHFKVVKPEMSRN